MSIREFSSADQVTLRRIFSLAFASTEIRYNSRHGYEFKRATSIYWETFEPFFANRAQLTYELMDAGFPSLDVLAVPAYTGTTENFTSDDGFLNPIPNGLSQIEPQFYLSCCFCSLTFTCSLDLQTHTLDVHPRSSNIPKVTLAFHCPKCPANGMISWFEFLSGLHTHEVKEHHNTGYSYPPRTPVAPELLKLTEPLRLKQQASSFVKLLKRRQRPDRSGILAGEFNSDDGE